MKNVGSFLAFTPEWFKKNQKTLLWFLNAPIVKYWARWILKIHGKRSDVGTNKILEIFPHAIKWAPITGCERFEFRTHPKFGKRIYYAFKPIWWMIHAWDWVVADRFIPEWSYGFDTLTAFPDPNPETTTVDGYVRRESVNETLSTITSGAGNSIGDSGPEEYIAGIAASATTDQYQYCYRGIFLFDTSSLPDTATISQSVFSLYITGRDTQLNQSLSLVGSTPASNTGLVNADYGQVGSTKFANDIGFGSLSLGSYNDLTMNATGIAAVSKTGVTKLGTRASGDIAVSITWVSGNAAGAVAYLADRTGTSEDPKLVITYSTIVIVAKTIQAKARVKNLGVAKTVTAKSRIKTLGVSKTVTSKARIKTAGLIKTITSKARISNNLHTATLSAKAKINSAPAGYFRLRSTDEIYQQSMKNEEYVELREQEYPAPMKDDRIRL